MVSSVLVTGSSRGIGYALVEAYAEKGWRVYATCREPDKAEALTVLAVRYANVTVHKLDVKSVSEMRRLAVELAGARIDLLINNAAIKVQDESNEAECAGAYSTNVFGPRMVTQIFLEMIEASVLKTVVYVGSRWGCIGEAGIGAIVYRGMKSAAVMEAVVQANELKDRVKVVVVTPGHVKTDMGGDNAPATPRGRVREMMVVWENPQIKSGCVYDYRGESLPF